MSQRPTPNGHIDMSHQGRWRACQTSAPIFHRGSAVGGAHRLQDPPGDWTLRWSGLVNTTRSRSRWRSVSRSSGVCRVVLGDDMLDADPDDHFRRHGVTSPIRAPACSAPM